MDTHRNRSNASRIVTGLTVVLTASGLASTAFAAPASAAPVRVKIVQHNVEKKLSAVRTAIQQARAVDAEGLTLQEVCKNDVPTIQAETPGWTVNWRRSRADGCGTDNAVGTMAIWTGGANGVQEQRALTKDDNRTPKLTCIRYGSSPVRHLCSAHLVSKDKGRGLRARQTADIKRITGGWIGKGDAVVVGGDFNAVPTAPEMHSMYALNGNGRFVEADQTATKRAGDWTGKGSDGGKRKIDYVFFSTNRSNAGDMKGAEPFTSDSDHRGLIARADVRR